MRNFKNLCLPTICIIESNINFYILANKLN